MRKLVPREAIGALVSVAISVALGIAWSQFYWGYPLAPPSWRSDVADVRSVEAFQTVRLRSSNDCVPVLDSSGATAVAEGARLYREYPTDFPSDMLAFELSRASKPVASTATLPQGTFTTVCQILDGRGLLLSGDSGYPNAKALSGALALVRSNTDQRLLFASLGGRETSNDHYPQYQAVFAVRSDGTFSLLKERRFFTDIAGIEGATWWIAALVVFVMLFPPVAVLVWWVRQ